MRCYYNQIKKGQTSKIKITQDQIKRLEEIGFKWKLKLEENERLRIEAEQQEVARLQVEENERLLRIEAEGREVIYEISLQPGPLGLTMVKNRVKIVNQNKQCAGKVTVGDCIVEFDGIDTSNMSSDEFLVMAKERAGNIKTAKLKKAPKKAATKAATKVSKKALKKALKKAPKKALKKAPKKAVTKAVKKVVKKVVKKAVTKAVKKGKAGM